MNKYFTSILVILLSVGQVISQSAEISDQLKENIQERLDREELVGVVVGTINGDQVAYHSTGVKSLKTNEAVDEHSIFEIGSISKTFTGLMLADMVVQGKMKLDDDIQMYLPDGIKAPTRDGQSIKLFHLSNHTSGFPRMPTNFFPSDYKNPFKDYTPELMYQFVNAYKLPRAIGSEYEYSNLAAGLLGNILATQNDKTYDELLISSIARPLSMDHTNLTQSTDLAMGHKGRTEMPNWDFASLAGAGAIRSSVSDMILYLSANMGLTDSELYPAMQLAHKNSRTEGSDQIVGLGWHTMIIDEKEIIWHNGQTGGYTSFMGWIKGTEKGVVVLNNNTENVNDIGLHALVPSFPLKGSNKNAVTVDVDEAILESYVGQYALAPTFILTVTRDGNQLSVGATGQSAFEVYPKSDTRFFYKAVEAELEFKKDETGKVESVTLFQGGREMPGKRLE